MDMSPFKIGPTNKENGFPWIQISPRKKVKIRKKREKKQENEKED